MGFSKISRIWDKPFTTDISKKIMSIYFFYITIFPDNEYSWYIVCCFAQYLNIVQVGDSLYVKLGFLYYS